MANEYDYTPDELEFISGICYDHARKCADYRFGKCIAYGGNCICNCPHFDDIAEVVKRELNKDY